MLEERYESEEELEEDLARQYRKGYTDGSREMLDRIRASLQEYPNLGGDTEISKSIDRICEEYYKQKKDEEWKRQFSEKVD
jgi:hypothetical protein